MLGFCYVLLVVREAVKRKKGEMMIKKEELVAASQLQPQLATMMLIGVFIYH